MPGKRESSVHEVISGVLYREEPLLEAPEKFLLISTNSLCTIPLGIEKEVSGRFPSQCSFAGRKAVSKNLATKETAAPLGRIFFNPKHPKSEKKTVLTAIVAGDFGKSKSHFPRREGLPLDTWPNRLEWIRSALAQLETIVPKGEPIAVESNFGCRSEPKRWKEVCELFMTHALMNDREFIVYGYKVSC